MAVCPSEQSDSGWPLGSRQVTTSTCGSHPAFDVLGKGVDAVEPVGFVAVVQQEGQAWHRVHQQGGEQSLHQGVDGLQGWQCTIDSTVRVEGSVTLRLVLPTPQAAVTSMATTQPLNRACTYTLPLQQGLCSAIIEPIEPIQGVHCAACTSMPVPHLVEGKGGRKQPDAQHCTKSNMAGSCQSSNWQQQLPQSNCVHTIVCFVTDAESAAIAGSCWRNRHAAQAVMRLVLAANSSGL